MSRLAPQRGRRRSPAGAVGLVLAAAWVIPACTRVPNDPSAVFSLGLDSLPSPSVVAGDTLRDTLGKVHPLTGRAYNIQGQVLTSVVVRFISLNPSQLSIDSANHALGAAHGDSVARVVADAHGLQSLPFSLPVVLKPTGFVHADTDSSTALSLSLAHPDSNISRALGVLLKHHPDSVGADSVTRTYIVHYQIVHPASAATGTGAPSDTTLPEYLVDGGGRPARTDTTDVTGVGTRRVRFSLPRIPSGSQDSVVVLATAAYHDSAVMGSPLRFVVHYTAP